MGEYDGNAPQEFADAIGRTLRNASHDKHFAVFYQPAPAGSPEAATQAVEPRERLNFGFGKLERLRGNVGYLELLNSQISACSPRKQRLRCCRRSRTSTRSSWTCGETAAATFVDRGSRCGRLGRVRESLAVRMQGVGTTVHRRHPAAAPFRTRVVPAQRSNAHRATPVADDRLCHTGVRVGQPPTNRSLTAGASAVREVARRSLSGHDRGNRAA